MLNFDFYTFCSRYPIHQDYNNRINMKKLFSVFFLAVFLLSLVPTDAEAQRWTKIKRYATLGGSLGASNYFGDIVPEASFTSVGLSSTRPNVSMHYAYKMFPRVAFRGSLSWIRITGDDAKSAAQNEADNLPRFKRNLSFRNDIKELAFTAIIDLFQNRGAYTRRPDFTPYGFIGIAAYHHNPKAYTNGAPGVPSDWYALQPLGTEGQNVPATNEVTYPKPYSRYQLAIPFGAGIKYRLDRQWDFGFEIGWRKTLTDYLDDVSGTYADKNDLNTVNPTGLSAYFSDRSAESGYTDLAGYGNRGDQRGDVTDKDWYIVTSVSLTYILPARIKGPKFR
jgi:hypothetical protein